MIELCALICLGWLSVSVVGVGFLLVFLGEE